MTVCECDAREWADGLAAAIHELPPVQLRQRGEALAGGPGKFDIADGGGVHERDGEDLVVLSAPCRKTANGLAGIGAVDMRAEGRGMEADRVAKKELVWNIGCFSRWTWNVGCTGRLTRFGGDSRGVKRGRRPMWRSAGVRGPAAGKVARWRRRGRCTGMGGFATAACRLWSATSGDLWTRSRNGAYAILAISLLRKQPMLNKDRCGLESRKLCGRKSASRPAVSNQGGPTLAFQLWHQRLIVEPEL